MLKNNSTKNLWLRFLPAALTGFRLTLAPLMLLNALTIRSTSLFGFAMSAAFISDIFDGVLARKLGIATPTLRRFDSATDIIFYLSALLCIWIVHPEIVCRYAGVIAFILLLESAGQTINLVKHHRLAATHAYSAKIWGISLFLAIIALLVLGRSGVIFPTMLMAGLAAYADWIAILLLSPVNPVDVKSAFEAWRARQLQGRPVENRSAGGFVNYLRKKDQLAAAASSRVSPVAEAAPAESSFLTLRVSAKRVDLPTRSRR